jgi:hypothetical protein
VLRINDLLSLDRGPALTAGTRAHSRNDSLKHRAWDELSARRFVDSKAEELYCRRRDILKEESPTVLTSQFLCD